MREYCKQFSIKSMSRVLKLHPSGYYSWLKSPLSNRAKEYVHLVDKIRKSWEENTKVYGYRKIYTDLREEGEIIGKNRVYRLMKVTGIKAQVGYKK